MEKALCDLHFPWVNHMIWKCFEIKYLPEIRHTDIGYASYSITNSIISIWKTAICVFIDFVGLKYDNDNDNEIIFIAKWHTDHVQRTWVKNRSGRNNIHEIYKTWQRGLEAIVAYVPQYQLYQADCLGSAEQKQCRVLELFQYKTRSFMRM